MNKYTGVTVMLISTLFASFLQPLLKRASKDIPPFTTMAVSMLVLFSLSLLASMLFEKSALVKLAGQRNTLMILILFGALNFISFWLVLVGLKYMPVWQVAMFGLLVPILSGIISYFLLGEALTINLFIGLIFVAIGLFIAVK
jgi:drug/metabolite transporter (DMT)-like permease